MPNGEKLSGSIRAGVSDAGEKVHEVLEDVADRIEGALERAEARGRKLKRQVKDELGESIRKVDRAGRENAFVMALGALAVGVVVGYLIGRDKK